jgi:uncharacterized protein DUF5996
MSSEDRWPPLPYPAWKETYETLHMWTQVVGKVALAQAPPLNHSWGVALQITPRGLATRTLPHDDRTFTLSFDFIDNRLLLRVSDGTADALSLTPMTVADFYRAVMRILDGAGIHVEIKRPEPSEVESPVPFAQDLRQTYDRDATNRLMRILQHTACVFEASRASFVGKCSPVHFFWGSFDLAITRFSGKRRVPPPDFPFAFMNEAYSHEVISHGFWPGGPKLPEPVFYAYAAPVPAGADGLEAEPAAAYYHAELGEFVLPYEAVRTAKDPAAVLESFIDSTYSGLARLAGWDRAALERSTPVRRAT